MRLLFVADGRSPIALNWIGHFVEAGWEVHLVTTFPCQPVLGLRSLRFLPLAFSSIKKRQPPRPAASGSLQSGKPPARPGLTRLAAVGARTRLRQWLGPLTLPQAARLLQAAVTEIQPDLVHAMRIPYEGMAAALALQGQPAIPLLISVWGNDFTLHAPASPLMGRYTRLALARATALHADCQRDVRLARGWGFSSEKRAVVLPGAGGVQAGIFYPQGNGLEAAPGQDGAPPIVINPRGIRAYLRTDVFFRSIPLVLEHFPQARFVCPTMAAEPEARRWVTELGIASQVDLLPAVPRTQMGELFRRAQVAVSPSTHDGTPNTLLEAMACGCFPVAGDLESVREWIVPGINGLLVDPSDPQALARATCLALERPDLRRRGRAVNLGLVQARADHSRVMAQAEQFLQELGQGK